MSNNKRIDIYTTPYNRDIVVANKAVTLEDLKEQYMYPDKAELDNSILQDHLGNLYMASCTTVTRKSDNKACILIKHISDSKSKTDKLLDMINTASHEACHAVLDVYMQIGARIDMENQELFAWEQGYITECILKTWMNR